MRTSLYSILCIAIRVGAILLAVRVSTSFLGVWESMASNQLAAGAAVGVFSFGVGELALAALLWIYPGVLARLAAGKSSQQVFESPIDARELQQLAFALLGIVFVLEGLIDLINTGLRILAMRGFDASEAWMRQYGWPQLLTEIATILLGIALVLGSRGLVECLRRLRGRGVPPAQEAEADA
jgi:putative exporter of polyketide antibiotics